MLMLVSSPWLQPVVQRAESGPRLHRAGDQRDARWAGQSPECCGEYCGGRKALWEMEFYCNTVCVPGGMFSRENKYLTANSSSYTFKQCLNKKRIKCALSHASELQMFFMMSCSDDDDVCWFDGGYLTKWFILFNVLMHFSWSSSVSLMWINALYLLCLVMRFSDSIRSSITLINRENAFDFSHTGKYISALNLNCGKSNWDVGGVGRPRAKPIRDFRGWCWYE